LIIKQTTQPRVAQPGDIFILLVPPAQELHLLRQWQTDLKTLFGGSPVDHLHVTCQRFTPSAGKPDQLCISELKSELKNVKAFTLFADKVIQFHAPYWQTYVLRWRIQITPNFVQFRQCLEQILENIDCPSHFNRERHASCTALNLAEQVSLDDKLLGPVFPKALFTVKELVISQLQANHQFEILETIQLREALID
jgi:hypothetical protein